MNSKLYNKMYPQFGQSLSQTVHGLIVRVPEVVGQRGLDELHEILDAQRFYRSWKPLFQEKN